MTEPDTVTTYSPTSFIEAYSAASYQCITITLEPSPAPVTGRPKLELVRQWRKREKALRKRKGGGR